MRAVVLPVAVAGDAILDVLKGRVDALDDGGALGLGQDDEQGADLLLLQVLLGAVTGVAHGVDGALPTRVECGFRDVNRGHTPVAEPDPG